MVWRDLRTYDPSLVQVLAPIESVEVLVMESFPPQYSLTVVSGLPNACVSYGGYYLNREGDALRVEMVNWKSADPEIACAQVYSTVVTTIPLGPGFESGETYTVEKDQTVVIPPGAEHGFTVVGDETAKLIVVFPHMDPYSSENTTYLEGSRPASVTG